MKKVLKIDNLTTAYFVGSSKERVLHKNISTEIRQGELICILGLNGTGKSTLIRTLLGMQKKASGKVFYDGNSIDEISIKELSRLVSVVLTDKIDDAFLTANELVATARYSFGNMSGKLSNKDLSIIDDAFNLTKTEHLKNRVFSQLSDGEKQRILIARAMAQDTPLIMLDEPAAFIDSPGKIGIMEMLKDLSTKENKTILMTTHDIESALRYADIFWILGKNGEFETGTKTEIIKKGLISKFFNSSDVVFNSENSRFEKKN